MKIFAVLGILVTILGLITNILEAQSYIGIAWWMLTLGAWLMGLYMFIYWFDVVEK